MKDINISEVFCEILSGFSILVCLVAVFDIVGTSCIKQSVALITKHINATTFVVALFASYLLGLLMDVLGMIADEYIMEPLLFRDLESPNESEIKNFWKNVPSHVLSYRDTQWAYYSAYRNLFIIVIIGGLFWVWSVINNYGWWQAIFLFISLLFIEFALFRTMKALLKIYFQITKIQYPQNLET